MERRAKIAATLGPACDSAATLRAMIEAGLDVARLNFSHGEPDEHRRRVRLLRGLEREASRPIALMGDLQGPRFRVGTLPRGRVDLGEGERVVLAAGRERAGGGRIPVSYRALARDVRRGDPILLDDGRVVLRVTGVRADTVRCEVERGGVLSDHKGINLPGRRLSAPALTAKDRRDLALAVELGVDWLAVSFVRRPEDVELARRLLARAGSAAEVMAKIERPEAVDRLDAILAVSDGLLVARGDLGVELPPERVPVLQKRIVETAVAAGKPVVTATQMLDSMRRAARPTRAEASDVANAVLDGSACLLLTAETAAGEHPVEAVAMMARIIDEAERSGRARRPEAPSGGLGIPEATCLAGCRAAHDVGARRLVVFTVSGGTARHAASFRPRTPIVAFTPDDAVRRRLALYWGIEPRRMPRLDSTRKLMRHLDRALLSDGLAARGDVVVVLSGFPVGVSGTTNLMTVRRVGSRT